MTHANALSATGREFSGAEQRGRIGGGSHLDSKNAARQREPGWVGKKAAMDVSAGEKYR